MASDLVTTVISKLVSAKEASAARDGVGAGTFPVSFTLTVEGTVTVRKDTEKIPTVSVPLKEVIALFLARSGATREAAIALLRECITDVLASKGGKGGAKGALEAEYDAAFGDLAEALLATLPKTRVRGAVDLDDVIVTVTESLPTETTGE